MSVGLLALLDDVAALVKAGAASLDDIPAQVAKTSGRVSGIVIDDTAVTPKYVVGLDPAREVAIITQIAKKSLINKIVFLGPLTLLLGFFLPSFIQPLLMIGGLYLCFEGYEKIHAIFVKHEGEATTDTPEIETLTPDELEKMRVKSAVRTDFILSSEIMAIAYATVATDNFVTQIVVMLAVAIFITLAVYGFVALIVKADDAGMYLATYKQNRFINAAGRGVVKFMPPFLVALGYIGTAAMLWVGAEIVVHGIAPVHHWFEAWSAIFQDLPALSWLAKVTLLVITGVALGAVTAVAVKLGGHIYGYVSVRFLNRRST